MQDAPDLYVFRQVNIEQTIRKSVKKASAKSRNAPLVSQSLRANLWVLANEGYLGLDRIKKVCRDILPSNRNVIVHSVFNI
jgi:hypothetical protein